MIKKETKIVLQKLFILSQHFRYQIIPLNYKNFLKHSQITQKEFEQLAELLVKYPMAYAFSKFDVKNLTSPLHLL